MSDDEEMLAMFLHLARASETRRRLMIRDKLLTLAAVLAARRGLGPIAGHCRDRVLEHNPGHLVGRYPSIEVALGDDRFQRFVKRLESAHSREKLEHMLSSLGIEQGAERALYESESEYAAALLGTTPEQLGRRPADRTRVPPFETPAPSTRVGTWNEKKLFALFATLFALALMAGMALLWFAMLADRP